MCPKIDFTHPFFHFKRRKTGVKRPQIASILGVPGKRVTQSEKE
jgi:hypothetical protein